MLLSQGHLLCWSEPLHRGQAFMKPQFTGPDRGLGVGVMPGCAPSGVGSPSTERGCPTASLSAGTALPPEPLRLEAHAWTCRAPSGAGVPRTEAPVLGVGGGRRRCKQRAVDPRAGALLRGRLCTKLLPHLVFSPESQGSPAGRPQPSQPQDTHTGAHRAERASLGLRADGC